MQFICYRLHTSACVGETADRLQIPAAIGRFRLAEEQALLANDQDDLRASLRLSADVLGDFLVDPRFRIRCHLEVFDRPVLDVHDVGVGRGVDQSQLDGFGQGLLADVGRVDFGKEALPEPIKLRLIHTSANTNVMNIQHWAIEDLKVTPYPETRVYKKIAQDVCRQAQARAQIVLVVREQRLFFSKPETAYGCRDL